MAYDDEDDEKDAAPRFVVMPFDLAVDLMTIANRYDCVGAESQRLAAIASRFIRTKRLLLCDNCGTVHPDDAQSDGEVCRCGRICQRMPYAELKSTEEQ